MRVSLFLLICFFAWPPFFLSAQTVVSGRVLDDEREGVVGANVFLKGSYEGASTSDDGRFSFRTGATADTLTVVVSFLGYQKWEQSFMPAGDSLHVEARLKPAASELRTAVITAGAFEASDEKKNVLLRPLDIVTTAGATADIAGVFNTLPGTQKVGEEGRLFVRGGDAHETQTYMDGLLVPQPYGSSVPDLPARGRFSPFLFSGAAFSTGGYSAEFGQALSSTLSLETLGLAEKTETGISLMSVGLGLAHTQRWEKASVSASADYTNLGPYLGLVPQQIEWEDPVSATNGQLIFRHKPADNTLLKVQGSAQLTSFAMQYPEPENVLQRSTLQLRNDNYYLNGSFKTLLKGKWALDGGLAYSSGRDQISQSFDLSRREQLLQSKWAATRYFEHNTRLRFGAEHWMRSFQEDYTEAATEEFFTRLEDHYSAGFAELETYFGTKLALRMGARGEYSSLLGSGALSPRLSIAYKTGEHAQLSFAWGHFYQSPGFEFLRYQEPLGFEKAVHYLLNYQYQHNRRTFRVEGYYKDYQQLVRYRPETPWLPGNKGKGYARGVDLFYRDQASIKNGDFWISYSFLDTKRQYRDFPEPAAPGFASKHNLSVVYKHWLTNWNTQVGLTYSLSSPRPYEDPNTPGFNTERTRAYQDLSINASYLMTLFGQFTILHLSITNVPGFRQSFGYRYSVEPNEQGIFTGIPIEPPARRFFFVGLFLSID